MRQEALFTRMRLSFQGEPYIKETRQEGGYAVLNTHDIATI
jgi:hypothetical protein